ncbi:MAG: TolC family protein [Desulfococcaceae bacterium]|jgi:outer membrane protein TolC|nr:TolC family protein [Desulfococcaceae bacterium]
MMKKMMRDAVLVLGCLVFLGGCANMYQVDLENQRQANLSEDLELLQARENMSFPDPLTLSDVIRIGLENNLDMRISKIMGEISDDSSLAERLKMLPRLDVNGHLSENSEYSQKWYVDAEGNKILGNTVSEDKTKKTVDVSLSWNILDFGLSYLRARQAAVSTEIQKMEQLRQAQKLALDISAAFWKTVLAEKELDHIRQIEGEVSQYKDKADEMVGQRRLDPIAAKNIEKQMVELSIAANQLQADISGTRIELCKLMGLPPATRFTLSRAESFQAYLDTLPASEDIEPKKIEEIALKNRPELFSADLQEKIQQDEARAVLVSMFPGISFNASWFYDDDQYLVNSDWTNVGVSLAANLLSLPSKYMEWKAKDKSITMVKVQRLMLTAGIITQVHMALHDYRIKEKKFSLYDRSYKITEDLLSMSKERRNAGSLSDTAITQRLLESMVTKLERNRNLVDLLNSYNMLLVTLGLDHGRWREPLTTAEAVPVQDPAQDKDTVSVSGEAEKTAEGNAKEISGSTADEDRACLPVESGYVGMSETVLSFQAYDELSMPLAFMHTGDIQ